MTQKPNQILTEQNSTLTVEVLYRHKDIASGVDGFAAVGEDVIVAFHEQGL